MKTRTLVSALALMVAPALAHAGGEVVVPPPPPPAPVPVAPVAPPPAPEPVVEERAGGPYAAIYGGGNWLEDAEVKSEAIGEDAEIDFDTGWIAGGALGYGFDAGTVEPRVELDVAYRTNDINELDVDGETFEGDGDVSAISGMANAWVDVPVTERLKPYAGGGVGAAHVMADTDDVEDEDTVFAWQLGAGVAYHFTPRVAATADYRWFNTEDPSFSDGGETEIDYSTHNAMLGLRFLF